MTHPFRLVFPIALMTASVCAVAADGLTPEELQQLSVHTDAWPGDASRSIT
jgi:hypothetical protein